MGTFVGVLLLVSGLGLGCSSNNAARCGNGTIESGVGGIGGEECDDGNTDDNDGCSSTCQVEKCGDMIVQANEECDDGNQIDTDMCSNACKKTSCGDGVIQAGEQCDDGNTTDNDACTNGCKLPKCGDGIVQAGEDCDDGNTANDDGCSSDCKMESAFSAHTVTANWTFLTNNVGVACPPGAVTASLILQPADPLTHLATTAPATTVEADQCINNHFTTAPILGTFLVSATFANGTTTYATSLPKYVDLRTAAQTVSLQIYTDRGYLRWSWMLVDDMDNPVSCADAGAGVNGIVAATVTGDPDLGTPDKCIVGMTTSKPIAPASGLTVSIYATNNNTADHIGDADAIDNVAITGPNVVTDLGSVKIRIDGL